MSRRNGFTLLEVLVAVVILSAITGITLMAFQVVSSAWRRGMVLSDNLHHGDFVVDQLVMAMRSAYVLETAVGQETYGFWIEDNGDDARSSDVVSWVKLGAALVGRDRCELVDPESPHRVEFFVAEDESGALAATIRAWGLLGQTEDFDSDEVAPQAIARRIVGFNCRMQDPEADNEDEIEWIDEWEDTNRLPYAVEITLWMDPVEEGDDPIEMKRIVQIPLAPLSWGRTPEAVAQPSVGTSPRDKRVARDNAAPSRGSPAKAPGARAPSRAPTARTPSRTPSSAPSRAPSSTPPARTPSGTPLRPPPRSSSGPSFPSAPPAPGVP